MYIMQSLPSARYRNRPNIAKLVPVPGAVLAFEQLVMWALGGFHSCGFFKVRVELDSQSCGIGLISCASRHEVLLVRRC